MRKQKDISIKQDKRYNRDYNKWRKSVLKRDNYTCQECEAKDNLEVHHIKPLKFYPELYIEIDNGLTLCNKCHRKTDSYGYKVLSRYGRKIITTE